MNKKTVGNPMALMPLVVFLLLFIGTAAATKDFYKMPVLVAFIIASGIAILMNKKEKLNKKIDLFCKGAGDPNIILMCIIFILAGAFGQVAKEMGAVQSTVNFGLSIIPANLLVAGLFVIGCFISLSMGTSMGTIVAIAPIGIGIAEQTGIPVALALGAVIGGAMFGDNLSIISDTTIAAVRTQDCDMKDKFKMNFLIVLPAAIITAVILVFTATGSGGALPGSHDYNFVKILPYLAVLVTALMGFNVMAVLVGGIIFAGAVGIAYGSFDIFGFLQAVGKGMMGMEDLAMIAIIIGGLVELIKFNGGIDFLLNYVGSKIQSKKGGEFGIAAITSITDMCTANNTISIVMAGPLAKTISGQYGIDPRRSASILDIFSSAWQGIVPYGGQLLVAAGLAQISPFAIVPYVYYPMLMFVCGILAISLGIPNFKNADKAAAGEVTI